MTRPQASTEGTEFTQIPSLGLSESPGRDLIGMVSPPGREDPQHLPVKLKVTSNLKGDSSSWLLHYAQRADGGYQDS